MARRVFLIHGWDSFPGDAWLPWLEAELSLRGFTVVVPAMPEPLVPTIDAWVGHLHAIIGDVRESDIFVGHSVGCQAILRYFGSQQGDVPFAVPVICVAGWFTLRGLKGEDEQQIARPWLETPIDFDAARIRCAPLYAILSDDDPYVALPETRHVFEAKLGASVIVQHGMGHFSIEHGGVRKLPVVLDIITTLTLPSV